MGSRSGSGIRDLSHGSSPGRLKARKAPPADSPIHDRMMAAVGDRTFRHIAELTGQHPETVRRYLSGQAPSAEFLTNLCAALRVNGDWLLTGRGPMKAEDVRAHALSQANTPELFSAMANTLDSLVTRVERLEVFVQAMEVRLRARSRIATDMKATITGANGSIPNGKDTSGKNMNGSSHDSCANKADQEHDRGRDGLRRNGSSSVGSGPGGEPRAANIAGAVAKRSSPSAD